LPGSEYYKSIWITGIFKANDGSLNIIVNNNKATNFSQKGVEIIEKNELLKDLYKSVEYKKDYYVAGLLSKGVVITDKNLNCLKYLNEDKGLQNNEIRYTFVDNQNNIWACLNNGVSAIFDDSPFTFFGNKQGLSGVVQTSVVYDNKLYVGCSTGVYYMDLNNGSLYNNSFKPIDNSKGVFQIWQIDTANNELLCAGTSGFFTIKNNKAQFIVQGISVKTFLRMHNSPNHIIAATGNGLSLFEYKNNVWYHKSDIKNFNKNCRHIEQADDGTIWISDKTEGLYHIKLNKELDTAVKVEFYNSENGLPDNLGNYVFKINSDITFGTQNGFYKFIENSKKFEVDDKMNKLFGKTKISVTDLFEDTKGNIWFKEELNGKKDINKKEWEFGVLYKENNKYTLEKTPFYKIRNNIYSFRLLSENELLIGVEKGFVIYNLKNKKDYVIKYRTQIRKVELIANDSLIFGGSYTNETGIAIADQPENKKYKFEFKYNDIRFSFSSLYFEEPEKTEYKYYLQGNDETWTDWRFESQKEYSNLSPGNYEFQVKAKNLYGIESSVASFKFEILPPWYQTTFAIIFYIIVGIFSIWVIVQLSLMRLKKQKEHLERIVEERTAKIQMQNNELNQQKEEIEAINEKLYEQNDLIFKKNKDITASITYAKRIQDAMLPLRDSIAKSLPEYFIVFKPRDIVSGDFYWFDTTNDKIIITAVDCTGHGVPGAFMSMIGNEILTTLVSRHLTEADEILNKMNEYVVSTLKQEETENQDGMDMSLCVIDKIAKTVDFAGAKNPLVYIQNDELFQVKADKQSIGGHQAGKLFTKTTVRYDSPTWFYLFSDGYQDQFGGNAERKFMIKRMKELFLEIYKKPAAEQSQILDKTIVDWMHGHEQTDDILVIGFKLS